MSDSPAWRLCPLWLLRTALTLLPAWSSFATPLNDHDNGPLSGIFGLPDSTEGADLLPAGSQAWGVVALISSHSVDDARSDETLVLDGETTRIELGFRYGVTSRLELGVELPFIRHEPGGLDSVVDTWHDLFGFPDGPRGSRPKDVLEFRYEDAQGDQLDVGRSTGGLGDIRMFAGWEIGKTERSRSALRLGVKLPTGDSGDLLGSGGADLSLGLAGDVRSLWGNEKLRGYYRLGAVYLGEPDLLADRYNELVGHAAFGLGYAATPDIELRIQGAGRSALYDSPIETLGDPSAAILVGGNIKLSARLTLSLAVGEDLIVKSVPDVSFQIALRYRSE